MSDRLKFYTYFIQEEIYLVDEKPIVLNPVTSSNTEKEDPGTVNSDAKAGILVLFEEETQDQMTAKDRDFLSKVLMAVNHNLEEVKFCNIRVLGNEAVHTAITSCQAPFILAFGIEAAKMALEKDPQPYHPQSIDNQTLLLADTLTVISEDQSKKRLLWNALKKMF